MIQKRRNDFGGMYISPHKKRKVGLPAPRLIKAKSKGESDYWSIWPHKGAVSANQGGHSGNGSRPARMRKRHDRAGVPGTPNGLHLDSNRKENRGQLCRCGRCGPQGKIV